MCTLNKVPPHLGLAIFSYICIVRRTLLHNKIVWVAVFVRPAVHVAICRKSHIEITRERDFATCTRNPRRNETSEYPLVKCITHKAAKNADNAPPDLKTITRAPICFDCCYLRLFIHCLLNMCDHTNVCVPQECVINCV